MLSIIYSKKGNLVPRLKISEGNYKYELNEIEKYLAVRISHLETQLERFHGQLKMAAQMQALCDIAYDIRSNQNEKEEIMKEVAL
jgi:hypothetical protein